MRTPDLDGASCSDPSLAGFFDVDPYSSQEVANAAALVCAKSCPVLLDCALAIASAPEQPTWQVRAGLIWRGKADRARWLPMLAKVVSQDLSRR